MHTLKIFNRSISEKLHMVNAVTRELRSVGVHVHSYSLESDVPTVKVITNDQQSIGVRALLTNFVIRNGVAQGHFMGTLIQMEQ